MLIDLTQRTRIGKVYREGSEPLQVKEVMRTSGSGSTYKTYQLSCDTHNMGTHIDVMGCNVELEHERMIAEGIKFDVSHITDRPVMLEDLNLEIIKEGVYVFFQTNWDKYLEDDEQYKQHPEIGLEVVEYLVEQKVNMIGIDALGVGRGKNHGIIDVYLGKCKIYPIENLTHLEKLPEKGFKVYCMPIKVEGIDVWPVRVMAEV